MGTKYPRKFITPRNQAGTPGTVVTFGVFTISTTSCKGAAKWLPDSMNPTPNQGSFLNACCGNGFKCA